MSTIADIRMDVADTVAAALPDIPVWAYPPVNLAAPCAFVQLGQATAQPIANKWEAELIITLIGPGGDNEAAVLGLETMVMTCAQALSNTHLAPVTWGVPGTITIAGQAYFSTRLTLPVDVEPMEG